MSIKGVILSLPYLRSIVHPIQKMYNKCSTCSVNKADHLHWYLQKVKHVNDRHIHDTYFHKEESLTYQEIEYGHLSARQRGEHTVGHCSQLNLWWAGSDIVRPPGIIFLCYIYIVFEFRWSPISGSSGEWPFCLSTV